MYESKINFSAISKFNILGNLEDVKQKLGSASDAQKGFRFRQG